MKKVFVVDLVDPLNPQSRNSFYHEDPATLGEFLMNNPKLVYQVRILENSWKDE